MLFRSTVGIGKIGQIIYEGSQPNAKLSVEVINFGTEEVVGVQIYPYLTSVNAIVVGDTIFTLDLGPGDTSVVEFELTSTDSIVVGAIFNQAKYPDASYYTMPSKAFTIDFRLDKTYGSVSGTVSDSTSGLRSEEHTSELQSH